MKIIKTFLSVSTILVTGIVAGCAGVSPPSSTATIACAPNEHPNAFKGTNPKPKVVPTLANWDGGEGTLTLTPNSRIIVEPAHAGTLEKTALLFQRQLQEISGLSLPVVSDETALRSGDIALSLTPCDSVRETLGEEGYSFYIQEAIFLRANTATGVFYATQTLLQALSLDISAQSPGTHIAHGFSVDSPRYTERAIMFDVGRKFADTTFLKNYIKFMGWYKLNTLHLHLNDQARGTEEGWGLRAFRLKSDNPAFSGLIPSDGLYYTREEWDELETVAAAYGVQILPEIDSPGHAGAFVLANPSVGHPADPHGGTLDPTNPAALEYIKSVFDEFLPWFRSPSIHIGGDEASLDAAEIPLASQISYLNQLGDYLIDKGRTVVLWGDMNYLPGLDKRFVIQRWIHWGEEAKINWKQKGHTWVESFGDWYIVPFGPDYTNPKGLKGDTLYNRWKADQGVNNPVGGQICVWNDFPLVHSYSFREEVNDLLKDAVPAAGQVFWSGQEKDASGQIVPYSELRKSVTILQYGPDVSFFSNAPIEAH